MNTVNTHARLRLNAARWSAAIVAAAFALCAATARGQNAEAAPIPKDTCILELTLPEGATVTIDGRDYGKQRRLEWSELQPGQFYSSTVRLTFPDSRQERHDVLLAGGRLVRLASDGASAARPEWVLNTGHRGDAKCLALSRDGRYALTGAEDNIAILWDFRSGKKIRDYQGHTTEITSAAFSPDGRQILTSQQEGPAILWDLTTGRQVRRFGRRLESVGRAIFSPDGRWVLANEKDERDQAGAVVWDKETGAVVSIFRQGSSVTCMAFSPDGRKIVMNGQSGNEQALVLWDAGTGRELRFLRGHKEGYDSVTFDPEGRFVLSGSRHGTADLWDAASGQIVHTFDLRPGRSGFDLFSPVQCVAFSPEGRQLLTMTFKKLTVWDMASRQELRSFGGPFFRAACFAPGGKPQVAALTWEGNSNTRVRLYDIATGNSPASWHLQEEWAFHQPVHGAVSPDGRRIAISGGDAQNSMLFDTGTAQLTARLGVANPPTRAQIASFSADGRFLLTAGENRAILWDVETGKAVNAYGPLDYVVGSAMLSPDGKHVLTSDLNRTAVLWDRATAQLLRTFEKSNGYNAAAFSPDGRRVLATHARKKAILWDVATGDSVQTLEGAAQGDLQCLAFSPDGQRLVTGHGFLRTGEAILWDANTGAKVHTLGGHHAQVGCVTFSPDGRHVATGSQDATAMLWDAATGTHLRTFVGHGNHVTAVALTASGQRLLTSSRDGTARLWDVATGLEVLRFVGGGGYAIRSVPARSAYGLWGALGSALRLMEPSVIVEQDWQTDWLMMTPHGLFDGSEGGRKKVMFRVGGGLNVVPVDRFFQDFYYPGLLAAIWRGERPLPKVEMGSSLPPIVRILKPDRGGAVETDNVTLEVEAVDEGGGIRGPWLVQNGARVLAPGKTRRQGKVLRRELDVALIEGENHLEIRAASADGSWESEPARLTLRYERPLPKPELYVVAVGVNRYGQESMDLKYAAVDAQAMVQLFQERGPDLYRQVHPVVLVDEQATKTAILQAIAAAGRKARAQDTLVVFLAGHGSVVGQRYYFLPHGFRRTAASLEQDIRTLGLLDADLGEAVAAVPALKRMMIFDSGQSGRVGLTRTARDPFALRGAVERLNHAYGTFTVTSAAVSEQAQEVPSLGHGVLTYTLLAGLRAVRSGPLQQQWIQPGSKDRVAQVLEWYGFASSHVPRLTKELFGQSQEIQHNSGGTSFPVLPIPASATPPREVAMARPTTPLEPQSPEVLRGKGQSRVVVVAVGINQYAEEAMNLKFAREDARAVAALFRSRGPLVYREVHASEILDEHATRAGILKALEEACAKAQPEDTLCVFLNGHGTVVGQRYYFIPHDFRRQSGPLEEDIRRQGLPADVLADVVSKSPARKRLLILDTCASGGALELSRRGRDPFAFRGAIEKLGQQPGVFAIAASGAGAEAMEIKELGHGVLMYALLAGLRAVRSGPLEGQGLQTSSPDGVADVLEWFSYAAGQVPRLTKHYLHEEQHVQTVGQGTSFPVLPARER